MSEHKVILSDIGGRAAERLGKFGPMKLRVDKAVDETTRRIVREYGRAWQIVKGEAESMSIFAGEMAHAGANLSAREIANMDRVRRASFALERQVRELSKFTGVHVSGAVSTRFRDDIDHVLDALANISGIDRRFTRPSGLAMEGMILRSTGRIEASTRRLDAYQARAMKDALMRGLVYGDNPHDTGKRILDLTEGAFLGGGSRAATIARTEISDAHRYASRFAYNESEYVVGWKWLAQLSPRTCPACWAMHGTFHTKAEPQYGHANCRCTTVPVLADDLPEDHDLGDPQEIFWGLPREEQLAIMGPGRLKALEAGAPWEALTYLQHNPEWRPAQQVTRVADLAGLAELQVATTPGDVIEIPGFTNTSIATYAYTQGGLTVHALTGEQPTSGYVVARKGTSAVIDAREFFGPKGPHEFAAWMKRHGDRLDQPGAHVGMWYDTANGKVVLDVVEILDDKADAIALGRSEDQIAIFDLNTFEEIATGGTGGYADVSDALGRSDIGREATITREGSDQYTSGTVVAAGDWGVRIKTSDGRFINASPDQFIFESAAVQTRMDRIREVQQIETDADHGIPVDYFGSDPRAAKQMDDALDDLAEDWPYVRPDRVQTQDLSGEYGLTTTSFQNNGTVVKSSIVEVERKNAADLSKWSDDMRTPEMGGHFHKGTSDEPAEYTIDHEFGHVLTHNVSAHPQSVAGNAFRRQVVLDVYKALMEAEAKATGFEGDLPVATVADVPKIWASDAFQQAVNSDLSRYATSSPDELLAEGFAVFRDHGPGESVVADSVMRNLVNGYIAKLGVPPEEEGIEALFPDGFPDMEEAQAVMAVYEGMLEMIL